MSLCPTRYCGCISTLESSSIISPAPKPAPLTPRLTALPSLTSYMMSRGTLSLLLFTNPPTRGLLPTLLPSLPPPPKPPKCEELCKLLGVTPCWWLTVRRSLRASNCCCWCWGKGCLCERPRICRPPPVPWKTPRRCEGPVDSGRFSSSYIIFLPFKLKFRLKSVPPLGMLGMSLGGRGG